MPIRYSKILNLAALILSIAMVTVYLVPPAHAAKILNTKIDTQICLISESRGNTFLPLPNRCIGVVGVNSGGLVPRFCPNAQLGFWQHVQASDGSGPEVGSFADTFSGVDRYYPSMVPPALFPLVLPGALAPGSYTVQYNYYGATNASLPPEGPVTYLSSSATSKLDIGCPLTMTITRLKLPAKTIGFDIRVAVAWKDYTNGSPCDLTAKYQFSIGDSTVTAKREKNCVYRISATKLTDLIPSKPRNQVAWWMQKLNDEFQAVSQAQSAPGELPLPEPSIDPLHEQLQKALQDIVDNRITAKISAHVQKYPEDAAVCSLTSSALNNFKKLLGVADEKIKDSIASRSSVSAADWLASWAVFNRVLILQGQILAFIALIPEASTVGVPAYLAEYISPALLPQVTLLLSVIAQGFGQLQTYWSSLMAGTWDEGDVQLSNSAAQLTVVGEAVNAAKNGGQLWAKPLVGVAIPWANGILSALSIAKTFDDLSSDLQGVQSDQAAHVKAYFESSRQYAIALYKAVDALTQFNSASSLCLTESITLNATNGLGERAKLTKKM